MRVIIQTTYKTRINRELYTHNVEMHLNLLKMSYAFIIQTVQNRRGICKFILIHLAIQHTKRITLDSTLTVTAEVILHRSKESQQLLPVSRTAWCITHGIKLHSYILKT
ncbi:hypothetical protein D3C75_672250 [compost metagenome]